MVDFMFDEIERTCSINAMLTMWFGAGPMPSPALPGSSALRPLFHMQSQLASSTFQHQAPAVSLTPGYALRQQQHGISLASSNQSVRPSFSHLAHAQPAQSLQPSVPLGQPAHVPRQSGLRQTANMPVAAFMNGPRAGTLAPAASPRAFTLKPGGLPSCLCFVLVQRTWNC